MSTISFLIRGAVKKAKLRRVPYLVSDNPPIWEVTEHYITTDELTTDNGCGCVRCRGHETLDDFDPASHPRGQPENAGEFAARPGGAQAHLHPTLGAGKARTTITGEQLPDHIKKLVLPPAWTDVKYSPDPNANLLAVGKDGKGRQQSIYSAKWAASQSAAKFERIKALDSIFDKVLAQNETDRKSNNPMVRDVADCAHLVMKMGVRPGSSRDTKSSRKAYGATTLLGQHVVRDKLGLISLKFTGKDGVDLDLPVSDPKIAHMLLKRQKEAGPDGELFPKTDETKLSGYVQKLGGNEGGFHTKDLRTHLGTKTAMGTISMMPVPTDPKAYKKQVLEVAKHVSKVLGNTPTIALQSYIAPHVFSSWQMGSGAGA
jgi:DNA topoisomerase I